MSFVSIGDIAKQKFNQVLKEEPTNIVSGVSLADAVELLFGRATALATHHLYTNNGLVALVATNNYAFEMLNERTPDLLRVLNEIGMKVERVRIL